MGVAHKMDMFQYIDAETLFHSLKFSDVLPAVLTVTIAVISVIYLSIHRSRVSTNNSKNNESGITPTISTQNFNSNTNYEYQTESQTVTNSNSPSNQLAEIRIQINEINNFTRFMKEVNQEIEYIQQAGSLSDLNIKIGIDEAKEDVMEQIEGVKQGFKKGEDKLQDQLRRMSVGLDATSVGDVIQGCESDVNMLG